MLQASVQPFFQCLNEVESCTGGGDNVAHLTHPPARVPGGSPPGWPAGPLAHAPTPAPAAFAPPPVPAASASPPALPAGGRAPGRVSLSACHCGCHGTSCHTGRGAPCPCMARPGFVWQPSGAGPRRTGWTRLLWAPWGGTCGLAPPGRSCPPGGTPWRCTWPPRTPLWTKENQVFKISRIVRFKSCWVRAT